MDDEFPIDDGFVVNFPCFIVRNGDGQGFATHLIRGDQNLVMILTDEDSLNSYRHSIGMLEVGAVKCVAPQQSLMAVNAMPPQVTHMAFDIRIRRKDIKNPGWAKGQTLGNRLR